MNLLTGSPVRKAQVILNPGARVTITDSDGRYAIAGVAAGRYKLTVERPGFLPVVYGAHGPNRPGKSLLLAAGETRSNIDFTVEPPAVITGHIYDQDGEPLPAGVQVWRESFASGHRELDQAAGANADDEGEYRVYGLPPGRYYIASAQAPVGAGLAHLREVYPQTFYPGSEEITGATALTLGPGGEARYIDFHLRKTTAVTVAIAVEGILAPNQNVSLVIQGRDRKSVFRGNTNAGEFRIARVPPGAYTVSATSQMDERQFYAHADFEVGSQDMDGLRLTLAPSLELTGVLHSEVEPGNIQAILSNPDMTPPRHDAQAASDGKLVWTNLQPGTWRVSVSPMPEGTYLKSARQIEITPAEPRKPIEVVLSSDGASVEGTVANPEPVEGATVLLIAGDAVKFAITEANGKFALHGIAPGKYRLLAAEDLETQSWNDPDVLRRFDGKGIALELTPHQKAVQTLIPVL